MGSFTGHFGGLYTYGGGGLLGDVLLLTAHLDHAWLLKPMWAGELQLSSAVQTGKEWWCWEEGEAFKMGNSFLCMCFLS